MDVVVQANRRLVGIEYEGKNLFFFCQIKKIVIFIIKLIGVNIFLCNLVGRNSTLK
jgi:hypothetical protein